MAKVKYAKGMRIANTGQLARGTGGKYLEVMTAHDGSFIAIQWRRVEPANLAQGRTLIQFTA